MKRILGLFLVFWALALTSSHAQEGWSVLYNQRSFEADQVPPTLLQKQTALGIRPSIQVGALGLAPDGGWVVAYRSSGEPQLSWNGAPRTLMTQLEELKALDANIQHIVFSPLSWSGKPSWLIVYNDTEVDWENVPPNLVRQILDVHSRHETIRSIGLAINGGWVLVTDRAIHRELVPDVMETQLAKLERAGAQVHYVAFNVDNGWVILHDRYQGVWERLPNALVIELERLSAQQSHIRAVHFYTIRGRL